MDINTAEDICATAEAGLAEHYGITKGQYAQALLMIEARNNGPSPASSEGEGEM